MMDVSVKEIIELSILRAYKACVDNILKDNSQGPEHKAWAIDNITETTNKLIDEVFNDKPRNEQPGTPVHNEATGESTEGLRAEDVSGGQVPPTDRLRDT